MAIERIIPKDIRKYEPKLIGPLTTRQVIAAIPGVACCLGFYFGLQNVLTSDVRMFLMTAVAVPFILLGWYKPYGLPFEKFIRSVFISSVLAPPVRKYKTDRLNQCESENKQVKRASKKKKKKKNIDPMYQPYL